MEIPELNIISDFAAGMNCLQNPSLFSQIFSVSGTGKVTQMYRLCQLGALILALFVTFSGIISRIKLLIARFCKDKLVASLAPPTQKIDNDDDDDDDEEYDDEEEEEEEDESCSSASSSYDEDDNPTTSFDDPRPLDEDFSVLNSGFCCDGGNQRDCGLGLRRRPSGGYRCSWSEFGIGKSVVKLWDSLGLGLNFCEAESGSVVSIWDVNEHRDLSSFSGEKRQIPSIAMSSPAVYLSAGSKSNGSVLLGVHDLRAGGPVPALFSEWLRRRGKVVGIDFGGIEKVYVMDDVSGRLTVGDLRKMTAPLENMTECYGDSGLECWCR
ncbi:hypothetical protein U1Q18_029581 [Sarracenia purpurea var. burkii]